MVLDPATGTATFLRAVIELIHNYFVEKGQAGLWNAYVPEYVLKRIFGFELLMAPYAVAHLKLGEQLKETGYKFESGERLGVYLTNTLEEAAKKSETLLGLAKKIADESDAASHIKRDEPIMVVLGNPPYANFGRQNKSKWILNLLKDYKKSLNEKKLNLDDDFIKFIRFGQWRIEQTEQGILAFITSNTFIDGITHRRMRESLMETFTDIYILDLHGSAKKKEKCPDGSKDENVFDIMQGVSINLFIKDPAKQGVANVYHADLWGLRKKKYEKLEVEDISTIEWDTLEPRSDQFFFVPKDLLLETEYEQGWKISDIAKGVSGIETKRDHFAIDFDRDQLAHRINDCVYGEYSDSERKLKFNLRDNEWIVDNAIKHLRQDSSWSNSFVPCLHRPFDQRWIVYSGIILSRDRGQLMEGMNYGNLGLVAARQTKEDFAVLASDAVCTHKIVTVYDRSFLFPLYVYPINQEAQGDLLAAKKKQPNISPEFIEALSEKFGLLFDGECHRGLHTNGDSISAEYEIPPVSGFGAVELDSGEMVTSWNPEDLFCYAYAVFHSPSYRARYAGFLKIDFPRLPLTSDAKMFFRLSDLGEELVGLHLMRSPKLNDFITRFPHSGSNDVEKLRYEDVDVWFNREQCFTGVEEDDWNFHIGGYQVLNKWLKDRKGRKLSFDDIEHYQKIVVAIHETRRLMTEIDAAIPDWPIE